MRLCGFEGCGRRFEARGYCASHYRQLMKYGAVSKLLTDKTASERFWENVDKSEECWVWRRSTHSGYGLYCPPMSPYVLAHRFSYEEAYGEIPEGFQIDHKCHTRSCVRPEHLQAVTQKENIENYQPRKDNTSGFRGVSYHKVTGKWMAYGQHLGKNNYLGVYDTKEEAAEVSRNFRLGHHTNNLKDRDD